MEQPEIPQQKRSHRPILILLIWILFTLVVGALGYPRVKAAVLESGVLTLFANEKPKTSPNNLSRDVQVAFLDQNGKPKIFTVRQERLGGSVYHDTYEALLAGPSREALQAGTLSYIAPETQLIGLTLSNRILYIDLNESFLNSTDLKKAETQLRQTALVFNSIKDVVILVNGKVFTTTEQ